MKNKCIICEGNCQHGIIICEKKICILCEKELLETSLNSGNYEECRLKVKKQLSEKILKQSES